MKIRLTTEKNPHGEYLYWVYGGQHSPKLFIYYDDAKAFFEKLKTGEKPNTVIEVLEEWEG